MNRYNSEIHHRKSIRLRNWDYSSSALYFVTICVKSRENLFGKIIDSQMIKNDAGQMVEDLWRNLINKFDNIKLGEHVIMPNHLHGIIEIINEQKSEKLGDIVGVFKSLSTNEYILGVNQFGWTSFDKKLWQRNYYDHIIRDNEDYFRILEYINDNPLKWEIDSLHPENIIS